MTKTATVAEIYAQRVWVDQDLDAIDEFIRPNSIIHSALGDFFGPDSMKDVVQAWLTGFPDISVNNTAVICDKDLVVLQWEAKATHLGEFKGIPATGNTVTYSGVTIYRIDHQTITEYWAYIDMQHLLKQISL